MKYQLTCSLVTYNNDYNMLEKAINSFLNTELNVKLIIVDNSHTNKLQVLQKIDVEKIEYIHNPSNPGFGAAHNLALNKIKGKSQYHLILNPDIYFDKGVNETLISFMQKNKDVGIVMPKIVFPNGEEQKLTKLLPRPIDFIVRRLVPIPEIKEKINFRYELQKFNRNLTLESPCLSGCYMFLNTDIFNYIEGFDERYFMYCEDNDLCRQVLDAGYKNIFYPVVEVVHDHVRKSVFKFHVFKSFVFSMISFFNKWGWFFDSQRVKFNNAALNQEK